MHCRIYSCFYLCRFQMNPWSYKLSGRMPETTNHTMQYLSYGVHSPNGQLYCLIYTYHTWSSSSCYGILLPWLLNNTIIVHSAVKTWYRLPGSPQLWSQQKYYSMLFHGKLATDTFWFSLAHTCEGSKQGPWTGQRSHKFDNSMNQKRATFHEPKWTL